MMKNCRKVSKNISAYIDGELNEKEGQQVSSHLGECPECCTQWESLKNTIDKMNAQPLEELPDGLHNRLMEKIAGSAQTDLPDIGTSAIRLFFQNSRRHAAVAAGVFIALISLSAVGVFLDSSLRTNNAAQSPIAAYDSGAGMTGVADTASASESVVMQESGSETLEESADEADGGFDEPIKEDVEAEDMLLGQAILFSGPDVMIQESENKISRTYYITIETEDFDRAVKLIEEMKGDNISSEAEGRVYSRWINVSKRVDSGSYENAKELLQSLGTVKGAGEHTEELTNTIQDIEARLVARETEKERLNELLSSSKTLLVLTQVESRLSQVETEIEDIKGQMRYYNNQVNRPMLEIYLRSYAKETANDRVQPGFGTQVRFALYKSVNSTLSVMQGLLLLLSYIGVPAVVLLVICILIIFTWRKRKGRGA